MKTYIYKATEGGARGFDRTVTVYRVRRNRPEFLGYNDRINTAYTYGDKGEAVQLICKLCGHKGDSYSFSSLNISLWSV